MAKSSITEVSANNTFQVWLDKTNELVNLVQNDILTASLSSANGDITVGNVTLEGRFSANTIVANSMLRANSISPKTGSTSVSFTSPVNINTNQTVLSRFSSAIGSRLSFFNTTDTDWQIGFENNTTKNFVITNGTASLRLNGLGNLETTGTITSSSFIGNVTGTVSSISNHTTTSLTEGSNLYFTTARARSSISVSGALSYNSSTGVISITDSGIRSLFSGGTGVTYNNATGSISIGQAVATNSNVTFGNLTTSGTITSTGAISSDGDITAFASSSDIRKKENIHRIENALDKVSRLGGYTYNFKGDDRKITGVIAQELEAVLPEAVYEIEDAEFGKSKAVRYGNIVGLLIEAIKELKTELDEIKER